ncbi:hypothetical protein EKO27_g10882 [Xylaria grammica]|uniref:Short-chain dehydrogenase/reductase 3 n=1 Tax=Xylaria grammica TaxID=363999 RepID=A0A439CPZ3_9PEZI|nr:hypothetical protein EKO27_g10882 [Xylaria grammica]
MRLPSARLDSRFSEYLSFLGAAGNLVPKVIQGVLFFSIARSLNSGLNKWATNNWRFSASKPHRWSDEIVVVTGGSSGIGEQLVLGLIRHGLKVAVLDVQAPPESISDLGAKFYECDVTSSDSVSHAADAVRRDLGHPSILINNAGIQKSAPILKTDHRLVRKVFEVNTISHWITAREFLPRMIQHDRGHIVTVASVASFVGLPCGADYAASKAAALAFHESLTSELKHIYKSPGVISTIVHPNFVRTPLIEEEAHRLEKVGVALLTSEAVADAILAQILKGTGGQVIIPGSSSVASFLRSFPNWTQEIVRDHIGKKMASMATFSAT